MKYPIMLAVAASGAALSTPAAAVELVTNGGFESAVELEGWSHTDHHLHTFSGTQDPHTGNYDAAFGAGTDNEDTLSQTLATTSGQSYDFSFWLKNVGAPAFFSAAFGGTTLLTLTPTASFDYTRYSYRVTATSDATDITFRGSNPPDHLHLDDVSVTVAGGVPEPGVWGMMIVGFGTAGVAARTRRSRRAAVMA